MNDKFSFEMMRIIDGINKNCSLTSMTFDVFSGAGVKLMIFGQIGIAFILAKNVWQLTVFHAGLPNVTTTTTTTTPPQKCQNMFAKICRSAIRKLQLLPQRRRRRRRRRPCSALTNDDDGCSFWPIVFLGSKYHLSLRAYGVVTEGQLLLPSQWRQRRRRLLVLAYSLLGFKVSFELAHDERQLGPRAPNRS